jgi:hypothetical protein
MIVELVWPSNMYAVMISGPGAVKVKYMIENIMFVVDEYKMCGPGPIFHHR